ncbi:MAG TPA: sulfite exporter TauE/SafE family protein [Puia sp.]
MFLLILTGFLIGIFGTLIGAGGGFVLVPILILSYPELSAESITAISMAIVAANAISGSIAYARSGRIDFKAGVLFALFTIPGSILGVLTTQFIPRHLFNMLFGILLVALSVYLYFRHSETIKPVEVKNDQRRWKHRELIDAGGTKYSYTYNQTRGIIISIGVGYLSPVLGIGGGIIHVPALVQWLQFPVFIATATSHFILAIMATVSVIVHAIKGSYADPKILHMVIGLTIGVIPGAQIGAWLSHKIKGHTIIRVLAICLGVVGVRILFTAISFS